jgi:Uma2 family endonuclease
VNRKVDLLLAGGTLAVWVIYPEKREVRVYVPDGTSYTCRGDQTITLQELMPGWDLPVAKLFED